MAPRIDVFGPSVPERLDLIGAPCDSVDRTAMPPPSAEMLADMERRASEVEQGPHAGTPWNEVCKSLVTRLE